MEEASKLVEAVLRGVVDADIQKTAGDGTKKKESDIDAMTNAWLHLSGFGANGLQIRGPDKRTFTYRGTKGVSAIPDCVVVETTSGDLVLIVEDKAGKYVPKDGCLGQLYAEMLCSLWNNIKRKPLAPSKKLQVYGIRLLNHNVSFYRLDATVAQVQQVCDLEPKQFPKSYKKMVLKSHTAKPNQTVKGAKKAKVKDIDFLGMSLADPGERKQAQECLSKLRRALA